jgi:threonine dehydrogenase-like Zn-dependent dehydrogenase
VRAVVVRGPRQYGVEQVPEPQYGDYEALVQVSHCGICSGTDRHIIEGPARFPYMAPYPTILGHESIGRIVARGKAVRYLREGDLVLRPMVAGDMGGFSSTFGSMVEWAVVNDARALTEDAPAGPHPHPLPYQQVVPEGFEPASVGVFITFKETLSWSQDFGVGPGSRVAILGSGGVGLCFACACVLLGAEHVTVMGRRAAPLARAVALGAHATVDTTRADWQNEANAAVGGRRYTHVIEAVGNNDLLQQGLPLLASGGRIGQYGVPADRRTTFDWSVAPGTMSLHFLPPQEHRVHEQALEWIGAGRFNPMSLVDAVVPMSEVHEAFRLLETGEAIRVTLDTQQ